MTRAYNIFKSEFLLAAPYMYARARGDDGRAGGGGARYRSARRSHARARRSAAAAGGISSSHIYIMQPAIASRHAHAPYAPAA